VRRAPRPHVATVWIHVQLTAAGVTALLGIVGLGGLVGCGSSEKPVDRRALTVGDHRLSFVLAPELELIDLGGTVEVRSRDAWPGDAAFERIAFQDLGAVKRDGTPLDSAAVAALAASGLDSLADRALERLGYDGRVEVDRRRSIEVDGRPAVVLETWYRSTHQRYRRVAIIQNGGTLLAVEAQQGPWEIVGKHFAEVLATVVFGS
jgi:hypothetical protein